MEWYQLYKECEEADGCEGQTPEAGKSNEVLADARETESAEGGTEGASMFD